MAQKQYSGDGIAITPTADGAKLSAAFQKLEGRATTEGMWLESTAEEGGKPERFRVLASEIGRREGSKNALVRLPNSGTVQATPESAVFTRPGLVEEYRVSMDGVRQDFVVLERPAGDGQLSVTLEVEGAQVAAAPYGAKLTMKSCGREIAYSRLHVTDAKGRKLAAILEVLSPERLSVCVEDASAIYPVRIDPTFSDADWSAFGSGLDSNVIALAVTGNNLYVGGDFIAAGGMTVNRIAKWDGSAWLPLGTGMNNSVRALAVNGGDVYAGGSFTTAGGTNANRIAKWNGSAWSALGSGMSAGDVNALAMSGGDLYAGGGFPSAGGTTASNIAKWNGSTWSALGSSINNSALALAVAGNDLYVGGTFTTAGGASASRIAKWNGSAWSAVGSGMDSSVFALVVNGGDLYAGGFFTTAGGTSANRIAKWNGSAWSALGLGTNGSVNALVMKGNDLYVGGSFTTAGGASAKYISKWDGSAWSVLGTGMNNDVRALTVSVSSGHLFLGGNFTVAGSTSANRIAQANIGGSAAAPTITSISPNPVPASTSQQTVTINGANFVINPTVTLTWTGQSNYTVPSAQVTYVSATQVQMAITVSTTPDNWTVKVTNPDGQASNTVGFQVVNNLPNSPTFLETASYSDHVDLGWEDHSTNETGFKIERLTGTGTYSQIATVGANATAAAFYTDNTTSPRTTYTYRVRAYNAYGDSGYTNEVTATTPGGPPGAFTLSNNTPVWDASIPGPKVQLNWTASSDVGNYAVYRNGSVYQAGIAGTSYLNSANLTGGVTYTYFIRASNADGTTDSNTITVTMPNPVLAPEIAVESPLNTSIADSGSKSFGTTVVGANTSLTFTIKNVGTADLTGLALTQDGTDAGMFATTTFPSAVVGPGGSTTFTLKFAPTSAGSKTAELHIASNDSNENPFDITLTGTGVAASGLPVSLAIYGPASVSSGGSASYTCQGTYLGGAVGDVTSLCAWLPASAFPAGVQLINNKLSVPYGVQAGTVNLMARYSGAGGSLTSALVSIVIGGGWVPLIQQAVATPVAGSSSAQWLVSTLGTTFGDSPSPMTVRWELDGATISDANGIVNNVTVAGVAGTRTVNFIVTDGDGVTKMTSQQLVFNKPPVANQPVASFQAADLPSQGPLIQDSLGTPLQYDSAKTDVGLIVLVHGMDDTALSPTGQGTWLTSMRYDIEQCLQRAGKPLPNIGIYDWSDVSFPSKLPGYDQSTLDQITGDNGRLFYDLTHVKPWAVSRGVLLKRRILAEIDAGHINSGKPIHFIGHSAGGFVIGEAATRLQQQRGVIVDLVTMLDTPDPVNSHFKTFPNGPGTVERYISSWLGLIQYTDKIGEYDLGTTTKDALWDYLETKAGLSWLDNITPNPVPNSSIVVPGPYYRREVVPLWDYYRNDIIEAHTESRRWYDWNTVMGQTQSGFWNSPFYNGAPVNRGSTPMIQSIFSPSKSAGPASAPSAATVTTSPISGFDSFGLVTENNGVFTLTEQADVGIFKTMALPVGAMTLRFLYQCTSAGDGDMLSVRFGDRPPLYVVPETEADSDFLTAEVSIGDLAGLTDQLVIELVSRGNANAVVQVKQIELDETDDPDGDGLSTSLEQTISTNPLLYDTDADGISDWAEVNTTLTNPLKADSDGDGMGDAQEIIAGTNGMDASSVFRATGTTVAANGAVAVTWSAKAGKTYSVQRSDAPDFTNYTVVGDGIPGVEPTTSFTDSTVQSGTARMFYRVEVE